jgi:hypothetical protein
MKVELPYTKDSFDADAQRRFLSAVASSVATPVGNLYIKSVVETTSSRRGLRKLLAASVEVEFAIRVQDTAAQAAMIANEGLAAPRLNLELAKQRLPAAQVLTQPAAPAVPAPTPAPQPTPQPTPQPPPQSPAFSAAPRAVPARGLQLSVVIVAALPLCSCLYAAACAAAYRVCFYKNS